MSDIFTHGRAIECPECPGVGKRNRKPHLVVAERNYSGCSVDYGFCEECGKAWAIGYKVDLMTRAPDWDAPTRAECEAEQARMAVAAEAAERAEFERLKAKFETAVS